MNKPETEYVMVPREPDLSMCSFGSNAINPKMENAEGVPIARRCYLAMLASAPPSPEPPREMIERAREILSAYFATDGEEEDLRIAEAVEGLLGDIAAEFATIRDEALSLAPSPSSVEPTQFDAPKVARKILTRLGYALEPSNDPGANPRLDWIVEILEKELGI